MSEQPPLNPEQIAAFARALRGRRSRGLHLEEEPFPTPLLGYRRFEIRHRPGAVRLGPFAIGAADWTPGVNTARCLVRPEHEQVPINRCGCGFYAAHENGYIRSRVAGFVVGAAIRATGRVVVHERGFRAERAEVVCLFPRGGVWESSVEHLLRYYDVPLLGWDDDLSTYGRFWAEL